MNKMTKYYDYFFNTKVGQRMRELERDPEITQMLRKPPDSKIDVNFIWEVVMGKNPKFYTVNNVIYNNYLERLWIVAVTSQK